MADSHQTQPEASLPIEEFSSLLRQQAEAIQSLKYQLSKQLKKEIANSIKQLEFHQALHALIGDLPAPLHGWPISPDFALQLVRLIRDQNYDLIIEFGSGSSTLICLQTFERFNLHSVTQPESLPRLITFEHLEEYHHKTNDLVESCVNRTLLNLRLSPLEPWANSTGNYNYYSGTASIREGFHAVANSVEHPLKVLVVSDGPPGGTCHWARYPAFPIVLDAASGMDISIDFLLDDMIRTDEKEMAMAWEERIKAFGLTYERIDYNFEKGGMLLTLNSLAGTDTSLVRSDALASERQELEAISSAITQVDELLAELKQVKEVASSMKEEAQQQVAELKQQLEAKGGELQKVVGERDARAKEKSDAQRQVSELMQQLERKRKQLKTQASALLLLQNSLKIKESEAQELQDNFHTMRLRHLRQRSR